MHPESRFLNLEHEAQTFDFQGASSIHMKASRIVGSHEEQRSVAEEHYL